MNDKYVVRAELLKNGYDKLVAKLERKETENLLNGVIDDPELNDLYIKLLFEIGPRGIKECHRLNKNKDNRTYQLRKRVKELLQFPCLFLTATFTDEVLSKTTEKTRREYVVNFLNSFPNNGYVANTTSKNVTVYTTKATAESNAASFTYTNTIKAFVGIYKKKKAN